MMYGCGAADLRHCPFGAAHRPPAPRRRPGGVRASSASWRARGHELHVAAQRVDSARRAAAERASARLARPRAGPLAGCASCGDCGACTGAWPAPRRFDLVHQLNPVDVGLSLALPAPARRSCSAPTCPTGAAPGRARTRRPARRRCAPSASSARRQQRRATTLLLSTPAAAAKLAAAALGASARARARRTASTTAPGARRRPAPAAQTVLFLANLEVRKGIHVLLDAFERARRAAARRAPADRRRRARARTRSARRVGASPALDRVELLGRVDRERALARHAGLRRLLPALATASRSG